MAERGLAMRYAHANGASCSFIVVYLPFAACGQLARAPREMVWLLGLVIFLLMMATAFVGYIMLPMNESIGARR